LLARDITYTNPFTQEEVTEKHYFHISKADLVEMEIEVHNQTYKKDGEELTGMQAKLQRIVDAEDGKAIMAEFKDIIRRSYGIKDGDHFRKSQQIWEDFSSTEAFSQLLFELCTQADAGATFIQGVVPHNLDQIAEEVKKEAEKARHAEALGTKTPAAQSEQAEEVATEPATGTTHPPDPLPPEPEPEEASGGPFGSLERLQEIQSATAENPVVLTEDEVKEMDSDEFRSGLATGKYKLS
jgi:hypothetical protein